MEFDSTYKMSLPGGQSIDYGILHGSERITFIKSGRGGTHRGDDDKYIKMAHRIRCKQGNTVICASNPMECALSYDADQAVIEKYAANRGFADFTVLLIGSSNGAYQNLFLAAKLPQTQKILCINMPLMINYHKITRQLQAMVAIEKVFVYGTKDPSHAYSPMLEMKKYAMCRIICVNGADHTFKDRIDEFIALADLI